MKDMKSSIRNGHPQSLAKTKNQRGGKNYKSAVKRTGRK